MLVTLASVELSDRHLRALGYFLGRPDMASRGDVQRVLLALVEAWLDDLASRQRLAELSGAPAPDGSEALPKFRMWLDGPGPAGD